VPERDPVVDLVGAEWQGTLWPHFMGGGVAGDARRVVLDDVIAHEARTRLTAVLLSLGVRIVLDRLVDQPDLASALDAIAGADDATIDRWAAHPGDLAT
jgi:hypothetical protein